jgi:hypothetical protein
MAVNHSSSTLGKDRRRRALSTFSFQVSYMEMIAWPLAQLLWERERERERERMKSSCWVFIIAFIIAIDVYGLSSSLVNSQADSCSSNLNLNGFVSFDTSSLRCLPVWDGQGFILRVSSSFIFFFFIFHNPL